MHACEYVPADGSVKCADEYKVRRNAWFLV